MLSSQIQVSGNSLRTLIWGEGVGAGCTAIDGIGLPTLSRTWIRWLGCGRIWRTTFWNTYTLLYLSYSGMVTMSSYFVFILMIFVYYICDLFNAIKNRLRQWIGYYWFEKKYFVLNNTLTFLTLFLNPPQYTRISMKKPK